MDTKHRYILEKGSKKHQCPDCNKRRFVHYIDTETGDYLPEQYGRCDRENKCAYHLNPYKEGYAKMIREKEQGNYSGNWQPSRKRQKNGIKTVIPNPVFIPVEILEQTLQGYEQNIFLQNLLSKVAFPFEAKDLEKVISLYYLGSVSKGYRAGAITFPFIDIKNNVRAIQVKQFDETNHTTGTDFLHSIIEKHYTRNNKPLPGWLEAYTKQDKRVSCLFGEHLLSKYPNNPVALVEAPKTAVYGTLYFGWPEQPENLIWLAVYNKSSFSFNKLKILQGRDVFTFPDLSKDGNTFSEWQTKAKEIENRLPGTRFIFSDLLEKLAPETDKSEGNDLADYLIKQDWRKFRMQTIQKQPTPELGETSRIRRKNVENLTKPHIEKLTNANIQNLTKLNIPENENLRKPQIKMLTFANICESKNLSKPYLENYISEPTKAPKPENWEQDISELENYFAGIMLPTQPVKLNQCSIITDIPLFIESHLVTLKANNGNKTFLPDLNRLKEFKQAFTKNLN